MKTIEERAKEWADVLINTDSNHATSELLAQIAELSYMQGATEQQAIDIDKACEWIKNYNNEHLPYTDLDCDGHCYVDMGKLAEEFRKAMKGE